MRWEPMFQSFPADPDEGLVVRCKHHPSDGKRHSRAEESRPNVHSSRVSLAADYQQDPEALALARTQEYLSDPRNSPRNGRLAR
jgi:hypothetical protein